MRAAINPIDGDCRAEFNERCLHVAPVHGELCLGWVKAASSRSTGSTGVSPEIPKGHTNTVAWRLNVTLSAL